MPKVHGEGTFGLQREVLNRIASHLSPESITLETGAGLSTMLFAIQQSHHTIVTPSSEEVDRIMDYCDSHQIPTKGLNFIVEMSWNALPQLEPESLDLVLVDGCHGFPTAALDFFYSSRLLKVGGVLVLDDSQLWPVAIVHDFLKAEEAWRFDGDTGKTSFFTKLRSGAESREWDLQPFVVGQWTKQQRRQAIPRTLQRIARVANHVKHGDFSILKQKLLRADKGTR